MCLNEYFIQTDCHSAPVLDRVSSASARARASASAPLRAMIYRILKRVPGGEQTKVFVGVCLVLGIGASPAPESAGAPPARARDERMAARARERDRRATRATTARAGARDRRAARARDGSTGRPRRATAPRAASRATPRPPGMAPVAYKKTKRGHDYFSSEKPEEVEQGMAEKEKAKYEAIVAKNTSKP